MFLLSSLPQIVKTSRESLSKSIRKRKDDAKLRVEIICDREEVFKALRSGPKGGDRGEREGRERQAGMSSSTSSSSSSSMTSGEDKKSPIKDGREGGKEGEDGIVTVDGKGREGDDTQIVTSRPCPLNALVRIDGELYGQILELWGFLCTFAQPLKVLTVPSISRLTNSIRACEPNFKKLRLHTRGAERSFEAVSALSKEHSSENVPSPDEAAALLDSAGLLMASTLVKVRYPDYHHLSFYLCLIFCFFSILNSSFSSTPLLTPR